MRYGERLMRETAERGLKRTVSQTGRRAGGGVSAGRDRETDRLTDDSQTQTRDVQQPKKVLSFRGRQTYCKGRPNCAPTRLCRGVSEREQAARAAVRAARARGRWWPPARARARDQDTPTTLR